MQTSSVEGQEALLNWFPLNTGGPLPETVYLGVFTTNTSPVLTPSTVPANSTQLANPGTAVGEPEIGVGGYQRIAVPSSAWSAPVPDGTTGMRVTASQQSFPESTGAWSNPNVCGYFIASSPNPGSGIAYAYANFEDEEVIQVNAQNIVVVLQPIWELTF